VKCDATQSAIAPPVVRGQAHAQRFVKVFDGRKQPIRGLWVRNGRYYAQLTIEDGDTGNKTVRRVPLLREDKQPVETVAQAVAAFNDLKVNRKRDELPVLHQAPTFKDFVKTYLAFVKAGEGQKRKTTIAKEEYALDGWVKFMGGVRLDKVGMAHVNAFKAKRLNDGVSPRTVNLDVIALNAVFKHALDEKWIRSLPTANLHPLKYVPKKRPLFTTADLDKLCGAAMEKKADGAPVTKNAAELVDFLRLLAYSGAREQEALALSWQDVDFEKGQVTIGAVASTKNGEVRTVDFNPKLRSHLEEMSTRRAPDSQWLFPSPQRGDRDVHAKTLRESLNRARARAEMPRIGFHDCRHLFISMGVMASLDFMTIASWVGHRDGGVLIGKVYGYLADTHKKAMAARLNFEPVVSPGAKA
jgi:integrase